MKIGARVTPKDPTLSQKHGFGCAIWEKDGIFTVHFENGTRGGFPGSALTRQLTKTEAARAAVQDIAKED